MSQGQKTMEHWFDYYKLQYERIAQHENQRLVLTNFIVVSSTAIFLFGTKIDGNANWFYTTILAIIIIALNTLAIQYIDKSRYWIKLHQSRARRIMEENNMPLQKLIDKEKKIDSNKDEKRRPELQKVVHYILIVLSLAYPFVI